MLRIKYDAFSDTLIDRKIERKKKQLELAHLEKDLRQKKEEFNLQYNSESKRLQMEEKRLYKELSLELAKFERDNLDIPDESEPPFRYESEPPCLGVEAGVKVYNLLFSA